MPASLTPPTPAVKAGAARLGAPMTAARLLVTGFGPFPGVAHNASGAAARALHGQRLRGTSRDFHLTGAVLPVTWGEAWPRLAAAVAACAPHALIMLGVSRRPGIEVERLAHNRTSRRPDAAGRGPGSSAEAQPGVDLVGSDDAEDVLDPFGPPQLATTLPWQPFEVPVSTEGFALGTSLDAGGYLCNFVFYKALRHLPGIGQRGFVHLPPGDGPGDARAGLAAVRALAPFLR